MRALEAEFRKDGQEWWLIYVPAFINVLLIGLFGRIYKFLAFKLVYRENHRYEHKLENSLINKFYMFQFVNTYISFFVFIFYHQSFKKL